MIGSTAYTTPPKKMTKQQKLAIAFICFFLFIACFALNKNSEKLTNTVNDQIKETEKPIDIIMDTLKQNYSDCKTSKTTYQENLEYGSDNSNYYIDKGIFETTINNEKIKLIIETYKNETDITAKKLHLANINAWLDKEYPIDNYGYLASEIGLPERTSNYSNKNVLIIFKESISPNIKDRFISEIDSIIENINFIQNDIPNNDRILQINNKYLEYLDNLTVNINKETVDEALATLVDKTDKSVTMAYISYSQKMINEVRKNINPFNFTALNATYKKWQRMLAKSEKCLQNNTTLQEIDDLRLPYIQKEYGPGIYEAGVDLIPGEYIVNRTKANKRYDNSYEYESDLKHRIVYLFSGSVISVPDNGTMYHIDNAPTTPLDGPGIYKVGLDIPAGKYQAYTENNVGYIPFYKITDIKTDEKITFETNKNGKLFTLTDGEYLLFWRDELLFRKIDG